VALRWLKVEAAVQAVMLLAIVVYVLAMSGSRSRDWSWIAPAAGALLGSALPLQLAVAGIARAAR
jgi:hypothetical protein